MRQKPVNEDAVKRMAAFLYAVKKKADEGSSVPSFASLQVEWQISRNSFSSLKYLGIVQQIPETNKYMWNDDFQPGRKTALIVLDNILHKNKKQVHVPLLPELATAITLLSTVSEKMNNVLLQQEVLLKRFKQANNETAIPSETLFSQEEQESNESFQLLLAVTTGHYGNYDYLTPFDQINDRIMNAHQDLLTKYINLKSNKNERTKQFENQKADQSDQLLAKG